MNDQLKSKKVENELWVTDFTAESALEFRNELLEAVRGNSNKPIVIYIHSYGGAVDALASMIETMDEVSNPIVTVCHGMAMSCGAVLLSHGDVRFAGKNSRMMVHEVSAGTAGDVHDMANDAQELKRLNRHFNNLLAKNCGIKGGYNALRKIIKNQDGRDKYMPAKAALKFGLIDVIGMPRINSMKLYQVGVTPPKKPVGKKTAGKKSETKPRHRKSLRRKTK